MNRRALAVAFLVGVLGLVLLLIYQRRFELEASGGAKVRLLVAIKRLERGRAITEDMIGTRDVPMAYVDDRQVRDADKSKILGMRVATTVREQQQLVWSDFASGDERRDLSSLILPGYRGFTVHAGREEANSLIRPGDYVDVIGVLGESRAAVVLLQRVLVLALGGETTSEGFDQRSGQRAPGESSLTLSLTLPEAQILSLASERGKLTVVIRSIDDQQKGAVPDIKMESIIDPGRRILIQGTRVPQRPIDISKGAGE